MDHLIKDLFAYLHASPTSFHAVAAGVSLLRDNGFEELREQADWRFLPAGRYVVRRNDSSLIAFTLSGSPLVASGLRMAGAHTDSPGLQLKPQPLYTTSGWRQLGVEVYGGALLGPWFDRDLGLAGRAVVRLDDGTIRSLLLAWREPLAVIPSLAIHFDRDANKNKTINQQNDLPPVCGLVGGQGDQDGLDGLLLARLRLDNPSLRIDSLLDSELFLLDLQPPVLTGFQRELISAGRLDNLLSCHGLLRGLLDTRHPEASLVILNDHEEVGSLSTTGAQGNFLRSVLARLLPDPEERARCLARSFFLSLDNAHAVHPNFADRHDKHHAPRCNLGPVIKNNAAQRYATNALSSIFFQEICARAEVPMQHFAMRSDLACGSTIGPLTAGATGVATVDVGLATLAMHSVRELAGAADPLFLNQALRVYFALPGDDPLWRVLQ